MNVSKKFFRSQSLRSKVILMKRHKGYHQDKFQVGAEKSYKLILSSLFRVLVEIVRLLKSINNLQKKRTKKKQRRQ
jgi:hypothetical protein